MQLQMSAHHPMGAKSEDDGAFAVDSEVWRVRNPAFLLQRSVGLNQMDSSLEKGDEWCFLGCRATCASCMKPYAMTSRRLGAGANSQQGRHPCRFN